MREYWVQVHKSPIVYRYIDWSITVPLQMIEFNLILKAAGKQIGAGMFWRLLVGTVIMLAFGYAGETGVLPALVGFVIGMCGWAFIVFEIFAGEQEELSAAAPKQWPPTNTMRLIVTVGWAIYPLGYVLGTLINMPGAENLLNVVYNIADFVNKIGFVLAVWSAAKTESAAKEGKAEPLLA